MWLDLTWLQHKEYSCEQHLTQVVIGPHWENEEQTGRVRICSIRRLSRSGKLTVMPKTQKSRNNKTCL